MPAFEFGPLRLEIEKQALTCAGEAVPLPPRLFHILLTLLENAGRVVSQEELRNRVWPDSFVEDAAVIKNVSALRGVLRSCVGDTEVIRTLSKRGYQLMLPVVVIEDLGETAPELELESPALEVPGQGAALRGADPNPAMVTAIPAITVSPRDRPASRWLARGGAMLAIAVLASVVLGYRWNRARQTAATAGPPSLAILHLRNLAGQPDKRWMGVALGESLANDLSRGNGLRLISTADVADAERDLGTTDVQTFDQPTVDALTKRLGSDLVVTGTYLPEGDHVRLDLSLRNVHTGALVAQYGQVARQNNLQQLVGDASRDMRDALHLPPLAPNLADPDLALGTDPEGLHHLAEGLRLYRSGELVAAKPELEAAVAASPLAPLALSALAREDRGLGLEVEASENARLALAAAKGLPREQGLVVEGESNLSLRDYAKAAAAFDQLHKLAPENIDYIYQLAYTYHQQAKPDRTLDTLKLLPASALLPTPSALLPLYQAYAAHDAADYKTELLRAGQAVQLAEAQGRRGTLERALLSEGKAWEMLGDLPHALDDDRRAEQVARDRKDWQAVSASLLQQGNVLVAQNSPETLPTLTRALSFSQQGGSRSNEAAILITIGNFYFHGADFDRASEFYHKAVKLNHEIPNLGNEQIALANAAEAELNAHPEQSLRDAKESYTLAVTLKNLHVQSLSVWAIGLGELQLGQTRPARTHLQQALALAKGVGKADNVADLLKDLSLLELKCGNLPTAHSLFEEAEDKHAVTGTDADLLTIAKANLAIEEGAPGSAAGTLGGLVDKINDPTIASQAGAVLAESLLVQNRIPAARAAINKALAETKKLPGDPDGNGQVELIEARIAAAEGNLPAASAALSRLKVDAQGWKDAWLVGEIGLAQAGVTLGQGRSAQAEKQLLSVRQDATRIGFGLLITKSNEKMTAPK